MSAANRVSTNRHLLLPQCYLDAISVVGAGNNRQHRCCFSSISVILRQVRSPGTAAVNWLFDKGCCWFWCKGSCWTGSWPWRNGSCWTSSWPWTESRLFEVCVAVIPSFEADIQEEWRLTVIDDVVEHCAGQIQLLSTKYALRSINQPDRVSSSIRGVCGL